jgi:uncharacterized phage protein (TIGR01671 family)
MGVGVRDIRFRAWNVITKTMIDLKKITPLALNMDTDGLFIPFSDGLLLMQYTGLKDKNGKEIYEGDILSPGYTEDELFVVVFDDTKARFAEKRVSKKYPTHAGFIMDGSFLRTNMLSQKVEIIGNIYENPELLT